MARYTGSVCRLCRREGNKLFLKGERCYTPKCAIERHNYAPGQHGKARARPSEFRSQLRAKQKVKRHYGVQETQFRRYFSEADRRKGITGEVLLQMLELRLDNVLFRMGFARSRREARQIVRHGHVAVAGKTVDIPSYMVAVGQEVAVRPGSQNNPAIAAAIDLYQKLDMVPRWLEVDWAGKKGIVKALPAREDITMEFEEQLIVEHYSK